MTQRLDMTMMYAMHDALRRDLERLARVAARTDDDPRKVLRTGLGWESFKAFLVAHHTAEDETLWPALQGELAGRPDDLALLDAMEAEHAAIDPLLQAIDDTLVDRDSGHQRLGDLVDALATGLTGHLRHEEGETLDLIGATLSEQQWQRFGQDNAARNGDRAPVYLPWLLDGADEDRAAQVLARMPEQLRVMYRDVWRPAYDAQPRWVARLDPPAA
jgi:hypothetical protein